MHPFIKNRDKIKKTSTTENKENHRESSVTKITEILSNISQVAMLGIVAWGYFYTVVPVIQKEKLEEDIAKLELEKESWTSRLSSLEKELDLKSKTLKDKLSEFDRLESEKESLRQLNALSRSELEAQNKKLINKQKEIEIANTKLLKTYEEIEKSEESLYENQKSILLGNALMPVEWIEAFNGSAQYMRIFTSENRDKIASLTSKSLIDPTYIIPKKIEELRTNIDNSRSEAERKANERILIEFETGLKERRHLLKCQEPNFEKWEIAFEESLLLAQNMTEYCVDEKWKKRISEEEWSESQVGNIEGTDFWKNQEKIYKESCSYWLPISIERFFREKWEPINKQCRSRISNLSKIVLEGELEEVSSSILVPPSEREVRYQLRKMIENW